MFFFFFLGGGGLQGVGSPASTPVWYLCFLSLLGSSRGCPDFDARPFQKGSGPSRTAVLEAVWQLLKSLATDLRNAWDWTEFVKFLQEKDVYRRWCAVQSVCILLSMGSCHRDQVLARHFSLEQINQLSVKHRQDDGFLRERVKPYTNQEQPVAPVGNILTHTKRGIVQADLCEEVVSVCGVLLQKEKSDSEAVNSNPLVPVSSTRHNLHRLALAVAAGKPVLLEGPVGCGKTSLVEHLALLTGRQKMPQIIKVQLGDQTDSKVSGVACVAHDVSFHVLF